MTCIFFGHKDTPYEIREDLKETLIGLIEKEGIDKFYVGNNGNFDKMVLAVLKELNEIYPQISYNVVYAYIPNNGNEDHLHTLYPEGIEAAPKKFAIDYRNKWMVKQADIVVAYINRSFGGAVKYVKQAERKGATIINLA